MNNYPIHITSKVSEQQLQNGLFIFIFRASKIPPHIGVIDDGKLYDITSVGPNLGLSVDDFYRTINRRKTEVIFVELDKLNKEELSSVVEEKVREYWKVSENTSCLHPIKDFLTTTYKIDVSEADFIFDLLPILHDNKLITDISQVNIPEKKLVDNTFYLTRYTQKDIENCIAALQRKERVTC